MSTISVPVEQVLVVPTAVFHKLGYFQGFSNRVDTYLAELLSPEHTCYRPRPEMERDPSFKQLIPYVVFQHTNTQGEKCVFQYTRGKGQGEQRLHAKRSVGIGGHISTLDASTSRQHEYREGMRRELEEEVAIGAPYREHCVGLINDDLTEVGRVHLGVVHLCEIEEPRIEPREGDICATGFVPVAELLADLSGFETWSQICLTALYGPGSP